MSVTMRQPARKTFGSDIAVLTPLYSRGFEAWQLFDDGENLCGRSEGCPLRVNMDGIENRHCLLILKSGQLTVRRLNGRIWVNDLPVSNDCLLIPGDILTVGPMSFLIETMARPEQVKADPTTIADAAPVVSVAANVAPNNIAGNSPAPVNATSDSRPAALLAEVSDARSSLLEERQKLLDLREQQIQEYNGILQDRERAIVERQRAMEERSEFLAEQKRAVEQQTAAAETLRGTLQKQKDDIERRMNLLSDREAMLNSQLESSATSYAQLEQSRAEFAARLDAVSIRERALEQRQKQCDEKLQTTKTLDEQLTTANAELIARSEQLAAREAALIEVQDALAAREAAVQQNAAAVQHDAAAVQREADEKSARCLAELAEAAEKRRAAEEHEQSLALREQQLTAKLDEIARSREEQEFAQKQLAQQKADVEARAIQLDQTAAELAARSAELAAQRVATEKQIANGSSKETRSVSQLAAIAAEREAAIGAREEAVAAQQLAAKAQAEISEQEARLHTWQLEINSRHAELADRVAAMKALWKTVKEQRATAETAAAEVQLLAERYRSMEADSAASADALAERSRLLQDEWTKLELRQAELTETETRLADLQQASRTALQNAETEREALQSAHKDLICERNSLMQFNQDLQSRSNGLSEREAIVVQQKEELRNRFDALNQQSAELQKHEAELNARASDLHRRVSEFKAESKAAREQFSSSENSVAATLVSNPVSEEEAAERKCLSESLDASEAQRSILAAERDALLTAVRELQAAMNNARADVQEASQIRAEAAKTEQTLSKLYQTIEDRSAQLQVMESRLRQSEELNDALKKQISELPSLDTLHEMAAVKHVELVEDSESESDHDGTELLHEIELMRSELQSTASTYREKYDELEKSVAVRDLTITELQQKIEGLESQLETAAVPVENTQAVSLIEVDELRHRIERSEEVLRDRDDLIRELRARLLQQAQQNTTVASAGAETIDQQRLQNEARELDQRANLLDTREEELRERLRHVTQSQEEVEQQRRQLLDARQQLEIARAEIQVAMKQHSAAAVLQPATDASARSGDSVQTKNPFDQPFSSPASHSTTVFNSPLDGESKSDEDGDASTDLRSELANLFGLKKPAAAKSSEPGLLLTDYLDLSEPAGDGKSVAFKFGEDPSSLIQPPKSQFEAEQESVEPEREENSDDFVRDYMEQLLSRSRKAAGNSLPTELKPQQKASGPQAANAQASAPQKQKSFIDQYMSGGFGDLMENGSMSATPPADAADDAAPAAPTAPLVVRAKVDRQKLRENMDSFRSLSTQSVENALVDHAIRQERINIYGRVVFTFVLILMTAFLAIANLRGIIHSPSLIWISLVAAIGAGAETVRKWYSVKDRGRLSLQPEAVRDSDPAGAVHPLQGSAAAAEKMSHGKMLNGNDETIQRTPASDSDHDLPHRDVSTRFTMADTEEEDRSKYFEL